MPTYLKNEAGAASRRLNTLGLVAGVLAFRIVRFLLDIFHGVFPYQSIEHPVQDLERFASGCVMLMRPGCGRQNLGDVPQIVKTAGGWLG